MFPYPCLRVLHVFYCYDPLQLDSDGIMANLIYISHANDHEVPVYLMEPLNLLEIPESRYVLVKSSAKESLAKYTKEKLYNTSQKL